MKPIARKMHATAEKKSLVLNVVDVGNAGTAGAE